MDDDDNIWDYKSSVKRSSGKKSTSSEKVDQSVDVKKVEKSQNKAKQKTDSQSEKKTKTATNARRGRTKKTETLQVQQKETTPVKQKLQRKTPSKKAIKSGEERSGKKSSETPVRDKPRHEGFCPFCQMPFHILPLSPSWHVSECMDCQAPNKECPEGLSCDNTMESHFKEYSHQVLAISRATRTSTQGDKLSAKVKLEFSDLPHQRDVSVSIKVTCSPKPSLSTSHINAESNKGNTGKSRSKKCSTSHIGNASTSKTSSQRSVENIDDVIEEDENDDLLSSPQDISELIDSMDATENEKVKLLDDNENNNEDDCEEDLSAILLEELVPDINKDNKVLKRKSTSNIDEDVSPRKQASVTDTSDSVRHDTGNQIIQQPREEIFPESDWECDEMDITLVAGRKRNSLEGHREGKKIKSTDNMTGEDSGELLYQDENSFCSQMPKLSSQNSSGNVKGKKNAGDNTVVDVDSLPSLSQTSSSHVGTSKTESSQSQSGKKRLSLGRKRNPKVAKTNKLNQTKLGKVDENQTSLTSFFKCSNKQSQSIAVRVKKEEEVWIVSDSDSDARTKSETRLETKTQEVQCATPIKSLKSDSDSKSPFLLSKKAVQTVRNLVHEAKKKNDQVVKTGHIIFPTCTEESSESKEESTIPKKRVTRKSAMDVLMKNRDKQNAVEVNANKTVTRTRIGPGFMRSTKTEKTEDSNTVQAPCDVTSTAVVAMPSIPKSDSNAGQSSSDTGPKQFTKRKCPFYKKIPETGFTVDAFSYGDIPDCTAYILSHFHYDHYNGLTKHFAKPMYCSQITANLVLSRIKVKEEYVHAIPLNTPCLIEDTEITMLEANHCPGSVLILFRLKGGRVILHTGDFRADKSMEEYPELKGIKISQLYLDTTYCNPSYAFPPQGEVINFAVNLVQKELRQNPNTLIVCGSYTIGKERIFIAIAQALGCKICVYRDKRNILSCLDDPDLFQKLSLNFNDSQLHVIQLGKLNAKGLSTHLASLKTKYTNVIALEPTGWSFGRISSLTEIKPKYNKDGIKIYGIPYSEHSSFLELKKFVQFIEPDRIIPTVNNGNPKSRKSMQDIFKSWFQELQQGSKSKVTVKQSSISTWFG